LLPMLKLLYSHLVGFITEVLGIVTSKERLKQLLGISLYRNALYLIVANIVVPFTGFIFWVIAARLYSEEEVGIASAAIAAMTLLATLSTLGLEFVVIRFIPRSENTNLMINSYFTVAGLSSLVVCGIFIVGLGIWSPKLLFLRHEPVYLAAFIIFTTTYTLSMIVVNVFVARRQSGFSLSHSVILATLRLPLPIVLAEFFHSFGIFASWGISWVIALIVSVLVFLPRVQTGYRPFPIIKRSIISEIAHFSLVNYLANLLWMTPGLILSIMVLNRLGSEISAYFYIAWIVGSVLTTIPLSISMSLFAEGSTDEKSLGTNVWRSMKLTFLILLPAVIIIAIAADKLLLVFGDSYSEEGTTLLRILSLSALPIAINYIYINLRRVQKKMAELMVFSAFVAIATLVVSYILLPRIGINGVGYAWLGSQGVVAVAIVISFLLRRPAV